MTTPATTYHAVVWLDHQEAHVLMFDRDHVALERIKSRSHHKHQGKPDEADGLFSDVAKALHGVHEVLLTGPGKARDEFRAWCERHDAFVARVIVGNVASDHPTDAQVVAMARQYFKAFDFTVQDPSL
jgi:stalled ribosome rescue protein Dom34